jgi:predicted permease
MDPRADLRYALRTLGRNLGFTATALITLVLGLALTTSIAAVLNAYLIRSMPYPESDRLYHVMYSQPGQPEPRGMALLDWRLLEDVVEIADATSEVRFYLSDAGYMREARGLFLAPGSALSVRVVAGRAFEQQEFRDGSEPVALIGSAFWRDHFGSDPQIVGRRLQANTNDQTGPTQTYRIVGVFSPDFRWFRDYVLGPTHILVPLRSQARVYTVRLREGVPVSVAALRITDAAKLVATSVAPQWRGVQLESVRERYVKDYRPLIVSVTVAGSLLFVIVCANVGILMLLRVFRRHEEIVVRLALGGRRRHIARMLAVEAGLVCGAGLAGGLVLTRLTLRLLAPVIETQVGRPAPGGASTLALDPAVVFAAGGLSLLVTLALSIMPAFVACEGGFAEILRRNGSSGSGGGTRGRLWSFLIAFQIASAFALLAGCGLMLRSTSRLVHTQLGFRTEAVQRSRLVLPSRGYPDAPSLLAFYERFSERISVLLNAPIAITNFPPFYEPICHPVETDRGMIEGAGVAVVAVTAGYFDVLDIPVIHGRAFAPTDRLGSEPVAIVSETAARRLWPGRTAVGEKLRTAEQPSASSPLTSWRTVVGVTRDVRQTYTDEDLRDIYIPFYQAPNQYAPLFIRTAGPSSVWLPLVRSAIAEVDRGVLINESGSLDAEAKKLLARPKFLTIVLTAFAAFAVLLTIVGIYGVTAYAAQQRRREVAIRIALGATRSSIARMFLREGSLTLLAGILCGLLGAAGLARILGSQLHGIEPFDAATLTATAVLMGAAALLTAWCPARRAAVRDPLVPLKES